MTQKSLWRGVLIVVLSVALATPARADSLKTTGEEIVIGIVVVTAAVAVTVTLVILHYKSKRGAITGCVRSGEKGLTVIDENSKQTYALSGNTIGIKPGDRMRLRGRREKPMGTDRTPVLEAIDVIKDFGVCQP
jgi:hypothetical protein